MQEELRRYRDGAEEILKIERREIVLISASSLPESFVSGLIKFVEIGHNGIRDLSGNCRKICITHTASRQLK